MDLSKGGKGGTGGKGGKGSKTTAGCGKSGKRFKRTGKARKGVKPSDDRSDDAYNRNEEYDDAYYDDGMNDSWHGVYAGKAGKSIEKASRKTGRKYSESTKVRTRMLRKPS